jgi:YfiH family protein
VSAERIAPDPDWIVPDWRVSRTVRALVTTRAGGVSTGPYRSFNVGFSTDDEPRAVEANRAVLRSMLPAEPRWLKQVHGARVVDADSAHGRPEADASTARIPGTVCVVQVADCLPVLFADEGGGVVAAAHAGWRGLAAGVLENTIAAMESAGASAQKIAAYIGPGIGPGAFEVGDEVREAYVSRDSGAAEAFAPHGSGKWLADLPMLATRALKRCGVNAIYGGNLCTYSDPQRFYSYRRDKATGRMAALIWIAG